MERTAVQGWIARYERAWRTAGTDDLAGLFAPDATYRAFEEWPFAPDHDDGHGGPGEAEVRRGG